MAKPNIFKYATKELSQDALIAWLLDYANPEYKAEDADLHECGLGLLKALFKKCEVAFPEEIKSVEITQQFNRIDVFVVVNEEYAIIIEDKTFSSEHSDQLERYLESIKAMVKDGTGENRFSGDKILPIYLKTGNQSDYSGVVRAGYKPFLRPDFLEVLKSGKMAEITNAIFLDCYEYLQEIEDDFNSWRTRPMLNSDGQDNWSWTAWEGFFSCLQENNGLRAGNWDYVANPSGGFLAFYGWENGNVNYGENYKEVCAPYLQLEFNKLCFKVEMFDTNRKDGMKWEWNDKVVNEAKKQNLPVGTPKYMRSGATMTIAVWEGDYRVAKDGDKTIDFEATLTNLNMARDLLASLGQVNQ